MSSGLVNPLASHSEAAGTHAPPTHSLPLQAWPHAPQLAGSTCATTHLPPQRLHPAGHAPLHTPFEHSAAPPTGTVHALPQEPRWAGSDCVSTHAPLQGTKPTRHAMPQTPPEQVANPFGGALQTFEQLPQWVGSVTRFTQRSVHAVS